MAVEDPTTTSMENLSVKNSAGECVVEQRVELICRGLEEILGGKDRVTKLVQKRDTESKSVQIYWGTAITGKPHIGYLVPLAKIADFIKAGCSVILIIYLARW